MVPVIVELSVTPEVAPLQIVCAVAEPVGNGFTVTSTVKVPPVQVVGAVGVTVYLTTPAVVLLGFVNI